MLILLLLNILFTTIIIYSILFDFNCIIRWTIASSTSFVLYSILYFGILVLHMNYNITIIGLFFSNIFVLFRIFKKGNFKLSFKLKLTEYDLLFLFILMYSLYNFISNSKQWGQYDGWTIWNLHAKFLFYSNSWKNLFTYDLGWTLPDYPLMLPSIIALFWKSIGYINFVVPLLISVLPFIGILTLLYYSSKYPIVCVISVLLILIDSNFIQQSASQYADTLLAYFYLLSTIIFSNININDVNNGRIFYFLGFISASTLWIKNEGVAFFVFTSIFFVVYFHKERSALLKFGLGSILLLFVFGVFKFFYAPSNYLIYEQSLNPFYKVLDLNRFVTILNYLQTTIIQLFPIIPIFIVYFIVSKHKRKVPTSFFIIGSTFIVYLFVYIITPKDLQWHLETSLPRLIHQIYPALIFIFFKQLSDDNEALKYFYPIY